MVQKKFVIDDSGVVWGADDPKLAKNLHSRLSGHALSRFLTRNLGFVTVATTAGALVIGFNLRAVSPNAIIGAIFFMNDRQPSRVRVTLFDQPNIVPMTHNLFSAGPYLAAVAEQRINRDKIISQKVTVQSGPFADKWKLALQLCSLPLETQHRDTLLDELFGGFFALTVFDKVSGDYRIASIGSSTKAADETFASRCIGRTFREASDPVYGSAVADQLKQIQVRPLPQVTRVEAIVNWPSRKRAFHRYSRLALPLLDSSDGHRLLIATFQH